MDGARDFEIAAGSVAGRDHAAGGRNNQDAFCWWTGAGGLIAVVTDGCSAGRYSEAGARLGARLVTEAVRRRLGRFAAEPAAEVLEAVRIDVADSLRVMAAAMGGPPRQTIADHLLFTVVGAVICEPAALVFVLGDGVAAVNGAVDVIPSVDNRPAYLGYGLVDDLPAARFQVRRSLPAGDVESILIGSDGVGDVVRAEEAIGPLHQFWTDDRYFRNRAQLSRRLTLANRPRVSIDWEQRRIDRRAGLLPDDTTVVVARRRRA